MPKSIPALTDVFRGLSDWRARHGQRDAIGSVLTVAFWALLSGENSLGGLASQVHDQRWG